MKYKHLHMYIHTYIYIYIHTYGMSPVNSEGSCYTLHFQHYKHYPTCHIYWCTHYKTSHQTNDTILYSLIVQLKPPTQLRATTFRYKKLLNTGCGYNTSTRHNKYDFLNDNKVYDNKYYLKLNNKIRFVVAFVFYERKNKLI